VGDSVAVLTSDERATLRQTIARTGVPPHYTKIQINDALQAVEDWFQSGDNIGAQTAQASVATVIEAAAPGVFTVAHKAKLFALWCGFNARREGML
jgi:hypothetical protein